MTLGWLYFTKRVGRFGTDYLARGMPNLLGPGWNRPQDAVYPLSQRDAAGDVRAGDAHLPAADDTGGSRRLTRARFTRRA